MAANHPQQLAEAILANSVSQVTFQLDAGASVDSKLDIKCLPRLEAIKSVDEDNEVTIPSHVKVALQQGISGFARPLHLAMVNLYHSVGYSKRSLRESSKEILNLLLDRGADASLGSNALILCNISGYKWHSFESDANSYTALDLALFFKFHPVRLEEDETHSIMEWAIKMIQKRKKLEQALRSGLKTQTVPVVAEVAAAWKSLLYSEKFSDISFKCSDGVSIPAHRNVLAAASPYFETALNGPWAETSSGEWKTDYPSSLIRVILELVYTGIVPKAFSMGKGQEDDDPLMLLNVVSEYDIKPAIKLATNTCIESLNASNVKIYLQAAHLHDNQQIKKACFRFIQTNAVRVLTDVKFMALAQEDPDLWSELSKSISPADGKEKARKKARRN